MILFISDLHLDDSRPAISRAFFDFLQGRAAGAEALYILGDLFELWVGDDDDAPLALEVQKRLRALSETGTRVYFMRGNRDFLIGDGFAHRAGLQLLDDPSTVQVGDEQALLMHGDTLCTDDREYQDFRQQVRHPQWIRDILARPLEERRALGRQLREQSQSMNSRKAEDIMDVNQQALETTMQTAGVRLLIHGHTHRPARHPLQLRDGPAERIVLGDWDARGWCLEYNAGEWRLDHWKL